ncbi:hypothetical protein M899_0662 [Bacteriovorax sp. BSW11_IV]|uniref:hypothetical protein n=1 Tax=Bacteriovorax sp. BSW11_IV TaxID=1353529 RepID=UPI00038A3338|nr:hypothetical protein [Bacteriovorax sp. BSW11_IV]EQC49009.1 hypothetical protein M899_0662 [Bacteriovorax sp. BSW11_IV]
MKKLFLSSLIMLGTLSTFANSNNEIENDLLKSNAIEDQTYFDTLGEMARNGSTPKISQVIYVAWAGRCFSKDEPNEPTNAGYYLREAKAKDVGPIGNNIVSYEAASYQKKGERPSYFDHKSIEDIDADPNIKISFNSIVDIQDGIVLDFGYDVISVMKSSGKYLIEEIIAPVLDDSQQAIKNKFHVTLRCYYFIPEYNR